jgi:hypothetical protein
MTSSRTDVFARARRLVTLAAEAKHDHGPHAESELRRRATRDDPMLFALVYLSRHLVDPESGKVTLSDVHLEWSESAKTWMTPAEPAADRRSEIAPREMGKSTWHFLILPMWAAAHAHVRFVAAFADTGRMRKCHVDFPISRGAISLRRSAAGSAGVIHVFALSLHSRCTSESVTLPDSGSTRCRER